VGRKVRKQRKTLQNLKSKKEKVEERKSNQPGRKILAEVAERKTLWGKECGLTIKNKLAPKSEKKGKGGKRLTLSGSGRIGGEPLKSVETPQQGGTSHQV